MRLLLTSVAFHIKVQVFCFLLETRWVGKLLACLFVISKGALGGLKPGWVPAGCHAVLDKGFTVLLLMKAEAPVGPSVNEQRASG